MGKKLKYIDLVFPKDCSLDIRCEQFKKHNEDAINKKISELLSEYRNAVTTIDDSKKQLIGLGLDETQVSSVLEFMTPISKKDILKKKCLSELYIAHKNSDLFNLSVYRKLTQCICGDRDVFALVKEN